MIKRWFLKLKQVIPNERAYKTGAENDVLSFVQLCLRSLGPYERCGFWLRHVRSPLNLYTKNKRDGIWVEEVT